MLRKRLDQAALALQAHPGRKAAWRAFRTLRRLEKAAQAPAPPATTELSVDMDGLDMHGFGHPQLLHLYKEIFLRQDYAIDPGTDRPTIVDCGSNIGTSIAFFKQRFPQAQVTGFEPHPQLFPVLRANMDRNGMADVQLHNCALGRTEGSVPFHVSHNPGSLRSSLRSDRGGEVRIDVPMQRLSDHLRPMPVVDVLKIDVEGAERDILQDLVDTGLITKPRFYILEYHLNIGNDRSDLSSVLRLFEENGYDYNLKADRKMGVRFQDVLIYCSRRNA